MTPYTITEEPLDSAGVHVLLTRQDENLEPDELPPLPSMRGMRRHALKRQIGVAERELFALKRQLYDLPEVPMHGKIIMDAPSLYNCKTCHNEDCLNGKVEGAEGRIIRNQTRMNGCLAWLPPEERT